MIGRLIKERLVEKKTPFENHPVYSHPRIAHLVEPEYESQVNKAVKAAQNLGVQLPFHQGSQPKELITTQVVRLFLNTQKEISQIEQANQGKIKALAVKAAAHLNGVSEQEITDLFKDNSKLDHDIGSVSDSFEREPEGIGGGVEPEFSDRVKKLVARKHTHDLFIQGASISHLHGVPEFFKKELDEIHPRLSDLYSLHSSLIQATNAAGALLMPAEMIDRAPVAGHASMGFNIQGEVEGGAHAISLQTLVQEMSKALAEATMAHGLPPKGFLTAGEIKAFKQSFRPSHEPWQCALGPGFARVLEQALNETGVERGEDSTEGQNRMYGRTLLSMVPEKKLHELIPALFENREKEVEWRKNVNSLKKALLKAEDDYANQREYEV